MAQRIEMRLRTPGDFGFLPTVYSHGWFQCAPFHWDAEARVLTRVTRTAGGEPLKLRIHEPRRGELRVEAGGGASLSQADRKHLRAVVRHILQLDRNISGFHALCRKHVHLASIPRIGAGRFLRCPSAWEEMVKAICGTNVQWPQAVRMISLVAELGEPVEGLHTWPTPERVLDAGEGDLRTRCRLGYRAPFVIELASALSRGRLDPGPIERAELDATELRRAFLAVKGIGPATADYLMILNGFTGRLSIDSSVYAYAKDRHFGGRRPAAAEIERLYEPYGEWRALAYWFEALLERWWGPAAFDFQPDRES